jgi:hypothetical protein
MLSEPKTLKVLCDYPIFKNIIMYLENIAFFIYQQGSTMCASQICPTARNLNAAGLSEEKMICCAYLTEHIRRDTPYISSQVKSKV